jgi:glycosyltransferase involved in cell wall biosynthesis
MRVLWITANYSPEVGGLQTYTRELLKALSTEFEIGLITELGQGPSTPVFSHWRCPGLSGSTEYDLVAMTEAKLHSIAASFAPDIIHLANAGMAVYASSLQQFAPLIASVHGNDITSPWQLTPEHNTRAKILKGLEQCVSVVAVSQYVAQILAGAGLRMPCTVIHNTCDLFSFQHDQMPSSSFKTKLNCGDECPIILTVARLVPRKGHLIAVDALKKLATPWHWVVVGEGKLRPALARAVADYGLSRSVTLLDFQPADALADIYRNADIFVLTPTAVFKEQTSDVEGFGIVLHEAMASGLPVITSDSGGCPEAVCHGSTGLIVPAGDSEALAAAITMLLSDKSLRRRLSDQGVRYVKSIGGWKSVSVQYADLYRAARRDLEFTV